MPGVGGAKIENLHRIQQGTVPEMCESAQIALCEPFKPSHCGAAGYAALSQCTYLIERRIIHENYWRCDDAHGHQGRSDGDHSSHCSTGCLLLTQDPRRELLGSVLAQNRQRTSGSRCDGRHDFHQSVPNGITRTEKGRRHDTQARMAIRPVPGMDTLRNIRDLCDG